MAKKAAKSSAKKPSSSSGKALVETPDWIKSGWFRPLFLLILALANWVKLLQHGRVNAYILYILITLVLLLAWKVG